ncbi:outer membrane beta-barrel protein [Bradyrhizobium sediminis]|uniref:Outer membrane beta-barrel protein n=1 Tax=Bradyrhizobium sediminis TaxID=2840469 RepID=A0A975NWB1_9BRAD|nr:outer membrane beta-barrel protein [Bradyrhizobium sediminis]QWG22568.1 outer membrane beta-barrel protein [Bradyrhizobium sediminis]
MRRLLLAAMMFGAASGAEAADLPFLRGSFTDGLTTAKVNWQGYYIGAHAGYGSADENFNGSTSNMMAALLADTLVESQMQVSRWNLGLGKASARSSGYGGFAGYNWQWDDVIVGVEASYLHGKFGGSTNASEGRSQTLSDGFVHNVTAASQAAISITDMATLRARAAYAFGCFLPYAYAGVALGNANITRTVTATDVMMPGPIVLPTLTSTDAMHNHLIYGYSFGVGVDVNLIGGLFMRGEWEYVRFTSQVDTSINTVRAGLGYKF